MRAGSWLRGRVRRPTAWAVLAIGWIGMLLYANPGYLSFDSVHLLADARAGHYHDLAAVIWRVVDHVVPGPLGMLVLQTTCFLAGAYLVLRSCLAPYGAAVGACVVLWFPAISGTLGVIWTQSHAVGWLMLGTGWLLSTRLGVRIAGLCALALGAAMVVGGAALLLPLVIGLFVWRPAHGRWPRLAVAVAAALITAGLAVALSSRFAEPRAQALAVTPTGAAPAGLAARWEVFATRMQLTNRPTGSQVYIWFTDVQDLAGSGGLIRHDARASKLQAVLQPPMRWLGTTWLFLPYVYLLLAIALVPLAVRDRVARAVLGSGLVSALATFFIGVEAAFRSSLWLVVTAVLGVVILIARRARAPAAAIRSRDEARG